MKVIFKINMKVIFKIYRKVIFEIYRKVIFEIYPKGLSQVSSPLKQFLVDQTRWGESSDPWAHSAFTINPEYMDRNIFHLLSGDKQDHLNSPLFRIQTKNI